MPVDGVCADAERQGGPEPSGDEEPVLNKQSLRQDVFERTHGFIEEILFEAYVF